MARRHRHSMILAALVVLVISLLPGAVMADPSHAPPASGLEIPVAEAPAIGQVPPPESGMPMGLLMWEGLALLAGVTPRALKVLGSGGRVIAVGLSLALGVFTLATAVHSVHHLGDPEEAATCPVLSGSQHLSWGEAHAAESDAPRLLAAAAPLLRVEDAPRSPIYRPHRGRAPPA